MKIKSLFHVFLAILICESVGIIGSLSMISTIPTWYADLIKPDLNPPSWLFGPVWSVLYFLMGIAVYLIWKKDYRNKRQDEDAQVAFSLFIVQLFLNLFWSVFFFGIHNPVLALVDITALWVIVIFTTLKFYEISRLAGYILIPYIMWISFAMYLNYSIVVLN